MSIRLILRGVIAVLLIASASVHAKEVTLKHKGLTLNADLAVAANKNLSDGVILLTHGGLAHRDMDSLVYLRGLLSERGYNVLAINLSLGIDNRHGMYDCQTTHRHRNEDILEEVSAWMQWLKGQGAKQVVLLGHSRGGGQTALYAAEGDSTLVSKVVLLAPVMRASTSPEEYQKRFSQTLAPVLAKAEKLVAEGKGDNILKGVGLMNCRDTSATAASFVSYYGATARTDTPSLLPNIKVPTLVVVAGEDDVVVGLDKVIAPQVDGKRVSMKIIDGADHFIRDLFADDAVDSIDAFLKSPGS